MKVSVELPDNVFWALASVADKQDTKVRSLLSDIVADGVKSLVGEIPVQKRRSRRLISDEELEQMRQLRAKGKSWRTVATEMGMTVDRVYSSATAAGLARKVSAHRGQEEGRSND